jgi:hypothetical protein
MANPGPEQNRGYKAEDELTLAEKEAIGIAEALKNSLEKIVGWMNKEVMPIYNELELSQNYFDSTGNINYFTTVHKNREKLSQKLAEFNLGEELQNILIPNHLKIFAAENNTDIVKKIKSLNIIKPNKFHPVNVKSYITTAENLINLLDRFVSFTKSKKRGDYTVARQEKLQADLNDSTRPNPSNEEEKLLNPEDPEFLP